MDGNTDQNKKYFEELAKIRAKFLNDVNISALQSVQINIVNELLQKADNAQATYATFELFQDKLVFRFNGKKHFSITDPANDEDDLKKKKLGDINSITLITNINQIEPQIGEIGIGFKSIFKYTTTPLIYDANFCFKIEKYIIPSLLTEQYDGMKNDEMIIVIPFNMTSKVNNTSYNEIAANLKNLSYPNLFLKTISLITYTIENKIKGKIERNIELEMNYANIKVEFTNFMHQKNDITINQRFYIFSCLIKSYPISIAFLVDDEGFLKPLPQETAYCFFKTSEKTNLNYIINAPFLLTTGRTKIKPNDPHNQLMISELAKLSAKSLMIFKDIGQKHNIKLINDNILSIFLTSKNPPQNPEIQISFIQFYYEIQKVFLNEEIIPTENGFTSKKNAYWSSDKTLLNLINDEQLTLLVNNPYAKWVFKSLDETIDNSKIWFITSIIQFEICDYTLFNSIKPNYREYKNDIFYNRKPTKPLPNFIDCFDLISNDNVDDVNPFSSSIEMNENKKPISSAKWTSSNKNTNSSMWGKSSTTNWSKPWTKYSSSTTTKTASNNPFLSNKTEDTSKAANSSNSTTGKSSPFINNEDSSSNENSIEFKGISVEFIEKQSSEWLNSFYKWISTNKSRINMAKSFPIFLDKDGKAISAFDPQNNNLQLFFPVFQKTAEEQKYSTVNSILFKNEENFVFMRQIGISVPLTIKQQIYNIILPRCNSTAQIDFVDYFKKIIFYYQYCAIDERSSFIEELKNTDFLICKSKESKTIQRGKPNTLYFPHKVLVDYFESIPQTKFICIDKCIEILGENKKQDIIDFLILLGVRNEISISEEKTSNTYKYQIYLPYATYNYTFKEKRIDGFDVVFQDILNDHSKSIYLWNMLLHLAKEEKLKQFNDGVCEYFFRKDLTINYQSIFRQKLINEKWLITSNNEFVAPNEIFLVELPKEFNVDDPAVPVLADFLNMKTRKVQLLTTEYIKDHDIIKRAEKAGLLEMFMKQLETKEAQSKK